MSTEYLGWEHGALGMGEHRVEASTVSMEYLGWVSTEFVMGELRVLRCVRTVHLG